MSDELPAFSPGARDLLRELVQRGLPAHSLHAAALLVLALDMGVRPLSINIPVDASTGITPTGSTSASTGGTDAAASELLAMFDEIEADR